MRSWRRRHGADLAQATRVALVVGPCLLAINNLDTLVEGRLPAYFAAKAVLTCAVPFLVSVYSSISGAGRGAPGP